MASLAKTAEKAENTQEVREEEFSEKETQGQLLTVENDFIAGMLAAAAIRQTKLYSSISFAEGSSTFRSEFTPSEKRKQTSAARSIQSMFGISRSASSLQKRQTMQNSVPH